MASDQRTDGHAVGCQPSAYGPDVAREQPGHRRSRNALVPRHPDVHKHQLDLSATEQRPPVGGFAHVTAQVQVEAKGAADVRDVDVRRAGAGHAARPNSPGWGRHRPCHLSVGWTDPWRGCSDETQNRIVRGERRHVDGPASRKPLLSDR